MDRANGGKRQRSGGGLSGQTDRKTGPPSLIPEGEEISSVCRENGTLSARAKSKKKQQIYLQKVACFTLKMYVCAYISQ